MTTPPLLFFWKRHDDRYVVKLPDNRRDTVDLTDYLRGDTVESAVTENPVIL